MTDLRETAIYMITSRSTGKSYVGQTVSGVEKRWRAHQLSKGTYLFPQTIRELGPDDFKVETLLTCPHYDANYYEAKMVSAYRTMTPHGYNSTPGGQPFTNPESRRPKKSGLPEWITFHPKKHWWMVAVPSRPKKYMACKEEAIALRDRFVEEVFPSGVHRSGKFGFRKHVKHDLPVYVRYKGYPAYFRVDKPGLPGRKFKTIEDAKEYAEEKGGLTKANLPACGITQDHCQPPSLM